MYSRFKLWRRCKLQRSKAIEADSPNRPSTHCLLDLAARIAPARPACSIWLPESFLLNRFAIRKPWPCAAKHRFRCTGVVFRGCRAGCFDLAVLCAPGRPGWFNLAAMCTPGRPSWLDLVALCASGRRGWLDLAALCTHGRPGCFNLGTLCALGRSGWLDLAALCTPGCDSGASDCPTTAPTTRFAARKT